MNPENCDNELCEGHLICPNTGKEECTRVTIFGVTEDGEAPIQVYCFGCGEQHRIKMEDET